MSAFIGQLIVRLLDPDEIKARNASTQLYELQADFSFQSDLMGATITAEAGMVTDFASIPRPVWNLIDPEDPCIVRASVIHDKLCRQFGGDGNRGDAGSIHLTSEQAAQVLREAMAISGARAFQQIAVYDAVRTFGPQWN